ncbi:sporulation protein YpjB [Sporolactobacillus kofuensis]|uniref:Sporulation protein YpjB n=1 Tax=Sporolactobacillus kofuensis TaxID=269672 RepID=A0ABW1WE07_9BACL|nr:sporulation protein YpjB [Sporolactobacillus kofuensis]MCO7176748.1 sporulation protein YpjB [Sporolactobacillus kofuensis]
MKANRFALLCFLILFFAFPAQIHAESEQDVLRNQTEHLVTLSDRIFEYTDANQIGAATSLLDELSKQWDKIDVHYSEQDSRTIKTALVKLKLFLTDDAEQSERVNAAASLRLCFDALTTNGQPLWKSLHTEVTAPLTSMKSALKDRDTDRFQHALNQFLDKYALIYPAMVIDGQRDAVNLVDKRITTFSGKRLLDIKTNTRIQQLNVIDHELSLAFEQSPDLKEDIIIPVGAMGALVISVLCYTSWRRYMAEHVRRSTR